MININIFRARTVTLTKMLPQLRQDLKLARGRPRAMLLEEIRLMEEELRWRKRNRNRFVIVVGAHKERRFLKKIRSGSKGHGDTFFFVQAVRAAKLYRDKERAKRVVSAHFEFSSEKTTVVTVKEAMS